MTTGIVDDDIDGNSAAHIEKDTTVSSKVIALRQELKLGVGNVEREIEPSRTSISDEKASEIASIRTDANLLHLLHHLIADEIHSAKLMTAESVQFGLQAIFKVQP